MEALKETLLAVGDEVLVGLSNKGIVKRAYKDLEKEQPAVCWSEAEAEVTLSDAVCKIRLPLETSSCSCPSRSMCRHRITAILWLKQKHSGEKQTFSKEELAAKIAAVPDKKPEEQIKEKPKTEKKSNETQAAELAAVWKEQLNVQLSTGLTRLSRETEESLERLAILSHSAGFARLERNARELKTLYEQYFTRVAAFRTESLMRKLILLYGQIHALSKANTQEQLRALAGSFRDSYEPAGTLSLAGMGNRNFKSQNGYEGEIYYFLNTADKSWYTWTDARPTFYEGRRRPLENASKQAAPWSLNCNREQLSTLEIRLTKAKTAHGNRLSASQETKGEIVGNNISQSKAFTEKIVWDYRLLLQQYFSKPFEEQEETDRLALVGAARCGEPSFDQVEQRFFLPLCDFSGRRLPVSLRYSKEESDTIRILERLQKRLQKKENNVFAFFGRLYMEKGELLLYPIEFFDQILLPEQKNSPEQSDLPKADAKLLHEFTGYLTETEQTLADLFQSGLDSVLEETILRISRLAKDGESLGLHLAGEKLTALSEALQAKRHRMDFYPEPFFNIWAELINYLNICRELIAQDTAYLAMESENSNKSQEYGQ